MPEELEVGQRRKSNVSGVPLLLEDLLPFHGRQERARNHSEGLGRFSNNPCAWEERIWGQKGRGGQVEAWTRVRIQHDLNLNPSTSAQWSSVINCLMSKGENCCSFSLHFYHSEIIPLYTSLNFTTCDLIKITFMLSALSICLINAD